MASIKVCMSLQQNCPHHHLLELLYPLLNTLDFMKHKFDHSPHVSKQSTCSMNQAGLPNGCGFILICNLYSFYIAKLYPLSKNS